MIHISVAHLFLAIVATVTLSVATTGAAMRFRHGEKGAGKVIPALTALALALNLSALVWRATAMPDVRHVLAGRFDVTLLLATLVTAVAFNSQLRASLRGLDTFMLPVATLVQVCSFLGLNQPEFPGDIHAWFVVHQISFVIGTLLLLCGGVTGGAYLALNRVLRRKRPSSLLWQVAPLETWERSGRWSLLLGFVCVTFGGLTGICEASQSLETTSRDWLTDGFIIGCIVVWSLYAIGVAASWVVPRFRGRRAAQLSVVTGVMLVVVFLIVEKLSGVHQ